jgi:mannose-6-phosphate isomerase
VIERLTGVVQPYAWGSTDLIPQLVGTEPTGEPQAELWLGAHPLGPSTVGGEPLDQVLARDPRGSIGAASVDRFGPRLPFLLKVIAAVQPLSLQAHPTREQAEAGYSREEAAGVPRESPIRVYRDGWPKPEVLCALFATEALCGFRDPALTGELFDRLGAAEAIRLVEPLRDETRPAEDRIAEVFERLLRLDAEQDAVVEAVVDQAARCVEDGELGRFARTAIELGAGYPDDPGVLAALLMNRVSLEPNQALYLPAGNLHAYLRGGGVELMANSDNVMRGGLTRKHIDIAELMAVVDFRPGFDGLITPVEAEPGVWHYPTPAPEFALWRLECGPDPVALPGTGSGRILLVTAGTIGLHGRTGELELERGQSAFVTALDEVRLAGTGTAFLAASGVGIGVGQT